MIKMGRVYEEEGNLEAAYVLYLKYITLFLEKIHTHRSEQRANLYSSLMWIVVPYYDTCVSDIVNVDGA